MEKLRSWADRQVGVMLADYFPKPLTVLDRDISLGIVQATFDYAVRFGFSRIKAADILVLDESGAVTVHARSPWLTGRCIYRLPIGVVTTLLGMRHRPSEWIRNDLQSRLREFAALLGGHLAEVSDADLVALIQHGVALREAMFASRRRHFLPSFTIKIVADQLTRSLPNLTHAGDLTGQDNPTAVFRRDLQRLALIWQQVVDGGASADELDRATATFMATHGGRGQTFIPLVSDPVWDTHPGDLLAVLPALALSDSHVPAMPNPLPATKRGGALSRRLSEISIERDWMAFGYEQATRVMRNPVRVLGARWTEADLLKNPDDVMHLRLIEIEHILATGTPPDPDLIAARRSAFTRPPPTSATLTASGEDLHGVSAAPGSFTGVARVVTSPTDFASLQRGEILVCQMTSPAWLPLLMVAGAVVSDLGGILSHAAIVAREFGIPAVTGTGDATVRLISGVTYEVDGDAGIVRPHIADL
ncbi:MAG: PEP-utilizing enzyme [Verrucomicrobia bacterium]|nr:PEP-utilizing enzyme [Verrucomicrobiota bacterium]